MITDNPTWPPSKKINSYHLIETMIIYANSHKQKLATGATSKNPSDKNLINQMKYYENTWLQENVGWWDQEEAPSQGSRSQFQKKVRIFQELTVYFILWKTILSSSVKWNLYLTERILQDMPSEQFHCKETSQITDGCTTRPHVISWVWSKVSLK